MSDLDSTDPNDGAAGRRSGPRHGQERDLEIRLRLHVVAGDDDRPVEVHWVQERADDRAAPAAVGPGSGWSRPARVAVVAAAVFFLVAVGAVTASFLRPGTLAEGVEPASPTNAPVIPPTMTAEAAVVPEGGASGSGLATPADDGGDGDAGEAAAEVAGIAPEGPEPARLRIAGDLPPSSLVLVNGEEVRRRTLSLRPGRYDIEVRARGFAPSRTTLTLRAGEDRAWRPALQPLTLASAPLPRPAAAATPDPEPVETAPAASQEPPLPAAAEPAVDPEIERARVLRVAVEDVRGTLDRFAHALRGRNVAELRALYPAMTPAEQDRWKQFLESEDISNLEVNLAYVQTPIVRGDLAETTFDLVLQFRSSFAGRVRQPTRYGATLERVDTDWRIRSLQALH